MTPKEKAKDLVNKFTDIEDGEMYIGKAKECAMITVDEILKEYGTYYKVEVNGKYVSYWQEVKEEIKNL